MPGSQKIGVTGATIEGPTLEDTTYDNFNSMAFYNGQLYGIETEYAGIIVSSQNLVTVDVSSGRATTVGEAPNGVDSLLGSTPVK